MRAGQIKSHGKLSRDRGTRPKSAEADPALRLIFCIMCGRFTQKSSPNQLGLGITDLSRRQTFLTTTRLPAKSTGSSARTQKQGERILDRLWWGLIPHWCNDDEGGRKPINGEGGDSRTVTEFQRRLPPSPLPRSDKWFFEWKAIKAGMRKQPYAIGMKSGEPFALAGIWENWKRPRQRGMGSNVRDYHHELQ